jgi:hypothetical protein
VQNKIYDKVEYIIVEDFNKKFGKSFHGYNRYELVEEEDAGTLVRCETQVEWGSFFETWEQWDSKEEYVNSTVPRKEECSLLYGILSNYEKDKIEWQQQY